MSTQWRKDPCGHPKTVRLYNPIDRSRSIPTFIYFPIFYFSFGSGIDRCIRQYSSSLGLNNKSFYVDLFRAFPFFFRLLLCCNISCCCCLGGPAPITKSPLSLMEIKLINQVLLAWAVCCAMTLDVGPLSLSLFDIRKSDKGTKSNQSPPWPTEPLLI